MTQTTGIGHFGRDTAASGNSTVLAKSVPAWIIPEKTEGPMTLRGGDPARMALQKNSSAENLKLLF